MLVNPLKNIIEYQKNSKAIAAFNIVHFETITALINASETTKTPIILQLSQNCIKYHGQLEAISKAAQTAAEISEASLSLHLDHAEDYELIKKAVKLGFNSVMIDAAKLEYKDNIALTKKVVDLAHDNNVIVEAELGEIGGKDGAHAPGVRTNPEEAYEFVTATKVDLLAVAVGSSHAMTTREATLDHELIKNLAKKLDTPLVLHGSSGVPDNEIRKAISNGIAKVNISTQLNKCYTRAIRKYLTENNEVVDSRKYTGAGRAALELEAIRLIEVISHDTK